MEEKVLQKKKGLILKDLQVIKDILSFVIAHIEKDRKGSYEDKQLTEALAYAIRAHDHMMDLL